MTNVVCCKH